MSHPQGIPAQQDPALDLETAPLESVNGVSYLYDGDCRRVEKVGSKLYWYGSGDEILAETDSSGNTLNEYVYFGGKRIAMLPAGGSPVYYVEDMLGTSRVLTTSTGVVCYDADFYPCGGERAYTNSCPQNYKFEGRVSGFVLANPEFKRERDAETGNDDFGARYYSNRFGRWLSADWSAVPAPVPYANLTNPQNNNRMDGYTYDAAGNLLNDGTHQYFYDAENHLIQVDGSSGYCSNGTGTAATACYFYDANGHRVRSTAYGICGSAAGLNGGIGYIYDLSGHMITKVPTIYPYGGVNCGFEIYAGARHLVYSTAGDKFSHVDWLGTERVRTENGTVCESIASLPFGDGQTTTGGCYATSTLHFTGKERDSETGLDNFTARYNSSSFGRFMTADPLNTLDLSHPQKLNRYTYGVNNPLRYVDVGGRCAAPAVSRGQVGICVESYIRTFFLPGIKGKFALGDDRGPNPHGGTFRTQTLLRVDPFSHNVSFASEPAAGESCAILGCYPGVNHSKLSKISHDDRGNTYFTLTVYGENGYEANRIPGAPTGWIQMQFSFRVNAKGEVEVIAAQTKGYPSASIYSYDSQGNATDLWQQTESGRIQDLNGPMKPARNENEDDPVAEELQRQCQLGNRAACGQ